MVSNSHSHSSLEDDVDEPQAIRRKLNNGYLLQQSKGQLDIHVHALSNYCKHRAGKHSNGTCP